MDATFANAVKLVEETIGKLGLDPASTRVKGTDGAWTLQRGSASVLVTVARHEGEDTTYLRVASPVVKVPASKESQTPLFRRVLEMNASGLANAAFGLLGGNIVVVSERPAQGLDAQEVEQIVRHLAAVADTFDDRLAKEFDVTKV